MATAGKDEPQRRLTKADWIEAAMAIMAKSSVEQVRVERVATTLGISKGSFYWHFKDRDALLTGILEHWQARSTHDVDARLAEAEPSPVERLLLFLELPFHSKAALHAADVEQAIQGWARRSELAAEALRAVDVSRTRTLADLLREAGLDADEAEFRAHQAYAFLRYVAQRRDLEVDVRRALVRRFHDRLTRDLA